MSDPKGGKTHEPRAYTGFDSEIDVRSVALFGVGLAAVTIVVLAVLWGVLVHWKSRQAARDPRPSPLAEANAPRLPPEPRLQAAPVADMEALRARETAVLTTYGWVDRPHGVGRIPIGRAIDLLVANGLPAPAPEPTPTPPPRAPRRARRTR
jgi:hypothetical protein